MAHRNGVGIAAAIGTQLLYGCSFAFTKNITGTIDPFTLLGWRFVTALVAMLVLMATRLITIQVNRATLRPLLVLAVFQPVIYYVAETFGVMKTTASEAGLITSAIPVAILATALVVVRRRPTPRQLAGIGLTLVGVVATVVAGGLSARFDVVGYALLLTCVVAYALYAAFADRFASAASDMDKTFVMVVSGAVLFGTITLAQHRASGTLGALIRLPIERPDFLLAVLYLALGSTIGAFFLQNLAIGTLGATRYSTFIGVSTIAALAAAAIALGERPGLPLLVGGAIILAGVYLANRRT